MYRDLSQRILSTLKLLIPDTQAAMGHFRKPSIHIRPFNNLMPIIIMLILQMRQLRHRKLSTLSKALHLINDVGI